MKNLLVVSVALAIAPHSQAAQAEDSTVKTYHLRITAADKAGQNLFKEYSVVRHQGGRHETVYDETLFKTTITGKNLEDAVRDNDIPGVLREFCAGQYLSAPRANAPRKSPAAGVIIHQSGGGKNPFGDNPPVVDIHYDFACEFFSASGKETSETGSQSLGTSGVRSPRVRRPEATVSGGEIPGANLSGGRPANRPRIAGRFLDEATAAPSQPISDLQTARGMARMGKPLRGDRDGDGTLCAEEKIGCAYLPAPPVAGKPSAGTAATGSAAMRLMYFAWNGACTMTDVHAAYSADVRPCRPGDPGYFDAATNDNTAFCCSMRDHHTFTVPYIGNGTGDPNAFPVFLRDNPQCQIDRIDYAACKR